MEKRLAAARSQRKSDGSHVQCSKDKAGVHAEGVVLRTLFLLAGVQPV